MALPKEIFFENILIKENGTIIGGYSPLDWNFDNIYKNKYDEEGEKCNWANTAECFIFSL
jgi:hypothetical protein